MTAGYGDAEITIQTATGLRRCVFTKVLYMLELTANLLSTESLRKKGVFYRSDRQYLFIKYTENEDVVIADVYLYNGLPYLVTKLSVTVLNSKVTKLTTKAEASILVWHLRLGYIHPRKLVTIAKEGIIIIIGDRELYCIACLVA